METFIVPSTGLSRPTLGPSETENIWRSLVPTIHNPMKQAKVVTLNFKRAEYWLSVGAQPSQTVSRLLAMAGVLPAHKPRFSAHQNQQRNPPAS
eukprot:m.193178 g.193178  ORF g.193178 m.193178 type:complete len:94 (-) comp25764_c0_seq8:230-511(-)